MIHMGLTRHPEAKLPEHAVGGRGTVESEVYEEMNPFAVTRELHVTEITKTKQRLFQLLAHMAAEGGVQIEWTGVTLMR